MVSSIFLTSTDCRKICRLQLSDGCTRCKEVTRQTLKVYKLLV